MAQCTPKSFDLTGKVALITGASYGIGMAIAKAMAANGATIVFNDIKQELVDKGIAAYTEAGIKAHGYVCDVTDEDAVNARFVLKLRGRVVVGGQHCQLSALGFRALERGDGLLGNRHSRPFHLYASRLDAWPRARSPALLVQLDSIGRAAGKGKGKREIACKTRDFAGDG